VKRVLAILRHGWNRLMDVRLVAGVSGMIKVEG